MAQSDHLIEKARAARLETFGLGPEEPPPEPPPQPNPSPQPVRSGLGLGSGIIIGFAIVAAFGAGYYVGISRNAAQIRNFCVATQGLPAARLAVRCQTRGDTGACAASGLRAHVCGE